MNPIRKVDFLYAYVVSKCVHHRSYQTIFFFKYLDTFTLLNKKNCKDKCEIQVKRGIIEKIFYF